MVIEVNKDIDRYQESVAMGLTARQLIFSIASVVVGGGIVLLLYKYIGLTGSAYVAIPCVAPIALGGFYSFNGMNFYEYMGKKLHFMFGNRAFTYVSTEGEPAIKQLEAEQNEQIKKKGRKAEPETVTADSVVKKQEEFEAMKKKTRNMLLGLVAVIVAAAAGMGSGFRFCLWRFRRGAVFCRHFRRFRCGSLSCCRTVRAGGESVLHVFRWFRHRISLLSGLKNYPMGVSLPAR